MNEWRRSAIKELEGLSIKKEGIQANKERLAELKSKLTSISGSGSSAPVAGGGNKVEQKYINLISEIGELRERAKAAADSVRRTEKALAALTKEEQEVLTICYISRGKNGIERVMEAKHVSNSTARRMIDEALKNFMIAKGGLLII